MIAIGPPRPRTWSPANRVKARGHKGFAAVLAVVGLGLCVLASSCGQSTPSAKAPTPAPLVANPAASPPPAGGPVPARLLGDWFLPPAAVQDLGWSCRPNSTTATCHMRLTLTATTYREFVATGPADQGVGGGDVVVNNNEVDFFHSFWTGASSGEQCPANSDPVGRYASTVLGGVLHFTVISDACPRALFLTEGAWSRAS